MVAQLPPVRAHHRPGAWRLRHPALERSPTSTIRPTTTPATRSRALEGSGIRCPRSRATPTGCGTTGSATSTRTCSRTAACGARSRARSIVITGASSGIGKALALKVGEAGGDRGRWSRARRTSCTRSRGRSRQAGGTATMHPARPRPTSTTADRLVEDVLDDARARRRARQQRGPLDPALDRELLRPLPRLPAHDAAQLLRRAEADPRLPAGHARAQVGPHHQRLVDRRADQHAALLGLRREQERARRASPAAIASEIVDDKVYITTVYMPLVRTPMIAPTGIYDAFPTASPGRGRRADHAGHDPRSRRRSRPGSAPSARCSTRSRRSRST